MEENTTPKPKETTYFQEGDVTITNARVIIANNTYSLSNITSVSMKPIQPNLIFPLIILIAGFLLGLCGFANQSIGFLAFGSIGVIIGFAVMFLNKRKYGVRIGSASGESNALVSRDKDNIQKIVDAINTAIVERG
jgi:hypothetical protein